MIAVGTKMPSWVEQGFLEYQKRLVGECHLILTEIPAEKRKSRNSVQRLMKIEGDKIMGAVPRTAHVVALDMNGTQWGTIEVAAALSRWMSLGKNITLLIGGPEGLSEDCRAKANETWSLSRLTFPHPMVRIIVAEQLYRGWSMLRNHPYHK